MQEEVKTLKQYAKEAKKRLKEGFWQDYRKNLDQELVKAEQVGVSASKVKEYYAGRVVENIRSVDEDKETFYRKEKKILEEEGEISNALGRLTDKEVFVSLTYDEQQRYLLSLSEKYLQAVERFRKEKAMNFDGQKGR